MAVKFDSIRIEAAVVCVGEDVDVAKGLSAFDNDLGLGHGPAGVAPLRMRRGKGDGESSGKRHETKGMKGWATAGTARSAGGRSCVEVGHDVTHAIELSNKNRSDIFWPLGEVRR